MLQDFANSHDFPLTATTMNDICFYFFSDLSQLFRYLPPLLTLSKLNYEILKSKSAKSITPVISLTTS